MLRLGVVVLRLGVEVRLGVVETSHKGSQVRLGGALCLACTPTPRCRGVVLKPKLDQFWPFSPKIIQQKTNQPQNKLQTTQKNTLIGFFLPKPRQGGISILSIHQMRNFHTYSFYT